MPSTAAHSTPFQQTSLSAILRAAMRAMVLVASILLTAGPLSAADILLSPAGPISTPQAARDAARGAPRPARIVVADGTYSLKEPLALTAEDSKTDWVAAPGASPVFSGGERITGWKERDGLWVASIPEVKAGKRAFEQLWINGRRATRARHPNRGYLHIMTAAPADAFPDLGAVPEKKVFQLPPDSYALLKAIPAAERADLLVTITHDWCTTQARVADFNDAARSVRIKGQSRYPLVPGSDPALRFWLENYRAALDAPGEWFLDRAAGELLYRPLPGERADAVVAIVPVADRLLTIKGASDLLFRGLRFEFDNDLYPANGLFEGQAAPGVGAAIEATASTGIRFEACTVAHVGRHAIYFHNGCADSAVVHCHLHDLGGGGVIVGDMARPKEADICHHVVVDDCIIQHGGRRHPSSCGVTLTHTQHCGVTHCDIADLSYTGVSAGWNWGYGESVSRETLVENNHIHHLGWSYLSDMGGFYGLGTSPGTVIRGNHFHHINSHRYGGWGIYFDEGSCDALAENNLVHDTWDTGFHQHYGYANRVRNNIFAFGRRAQVFRTRNEPRLCFIYERNIVTWDPPATLLDRSDGNWALVDKPGKGDPADSIIFRDNLYWCTDGKTPGLLNNGTITWNSWRKMGRDKGSVFADPLFVDAAARDFRLKEGSPAAKIGFKPWDLAAAGVRRGDAAWQAEAARGHDYPTWEQEARPWPTPPFAIPLETFDAVPVGTIGIPTASFQRPKGQPDRGEGVGVTTEVSSPLPIDGQPAAKTGRSLKVQDAADLANSYDPILHIRPHWSSGRFTVAFDAMAQPRADWFFEMRGKGEYAAGPLVTWKNGRLFAGTSEGTTLAKIPAGEWFHLTITAETASDTGAGSYVVELMQQDGTSMVFPKIACKESWNDASYLLFSGLGTTKTAFFIDNLRLTTAAD